MGYSQKQRQRLFQIVSENSCHHVTEEPSECGGYTVWILRDGCGEPNGDPFEYFEDLFDFVSENRAIDAAAREDDVLNPELISERAWIAANDPDRKWSYGTGV